MENLFSNFPFEISILALNAVLFVFLLILILRNASKIKKMTARYNRFMEGLSDRNMEQLIDNCLDEVKDLKIKNKSCENQINHIERNLMQCIQKVGIVRYNAFENVGSDLSFSVALLDSHEDGIIISSIYSRDNSTTYAKPISAGKSKYALSAEEIQALDTAKKGFNEKLYVSGKQESL